MMYSIVIPTHNEEKRLPSTIKELKRDVKKPFEIIVVDDGTDATTSIAKKMGCKVFHFDKRIGKGAALNHGILKAKGSVIVTYDADGSAPAKEIARLATSIVDYDIVIASRYYKKNTISRPFLRSLAAKSFNLATRLLFRLPYSDTQCGLKLLRKKAAVLLAKKSKIRGFVWDVELLLNARRNNLTVLEIPIAWYEKAGGPLSSTVFNSVLCMLRELLVLYVG